MFEIQGWVSLTNDRSPKSVSYRGQNQLVPDSKNGGGGCLG